MASGAINPDEGNRAYHMRRDTDDFKTPVINIYDIDYAVLYHLRNNIAPTIQENGSQIPVQVMFAGGETWSQIQRHGYLRDKSRKVMTPVMVLRRTGIRQDDRFIKLDITGVNQMTANTYIGKRQKNIKNDWIHKTQNTMPSYEMYMTTLPEFVKVSYDLYIWTELTPHLNYIIEELIPEHKMPWGDSMQFLTYVNEFSFETINSAGDDRVVSATTTLEVDGKLMPEYSLRNSTVQKALSIKRVDFINESSQWELYPDHEPRFPPQTERQIGTRDNNPLSRNL